MAKKLDVSVINEQKKRHQHHEDKIHDYLGLSDDHDSNMKDHSTHHWYGLHKNAAKQLAKDANNLGHRAMVYHGDKVREYDPKDKEHSSSHWGNGKGNKGGDTK